MFSVFTLRMKFQESLNLVELMVPKKRVSLENLFCEKEIGLNLEKRVPVHVDRRNVVVWIDASTCSS